MLVIFGHSGPRPDNLVISKSEPEVEPSSSQSDISCVNPCDSCCFGRNPHIHKKHKYQTLRRNIDSRCFWNDRIVCDPIPQESAAKFWTRVSLFGCGIRRGRNSRVDCLCRSRISRETRKVCGPTGVCWVVVSPLEECYCGRNYSPPA